MVVDVFTASDTLAGRHDLLHNNGAFRVKCPFFNHGEGEKSNYCTFVLFSLRMFDLVNFYLLVPTVLTKANNLVAVGLFGPGLVVWSRRGANFFFGHS